MEEYRRSRMDEKMEQGNVIFLNQVLFDNTLFWAYFLSVNYPCSLHKETDCTMADFVEKVMPINIEWSDCFTQYDKNPDVFDESDGYLDHPTTLTTSLGSLGNLKIEFHPGDTIFFLNNNEIGCTGPHWVLSKIPYQTIKNVLELEYGEVLFELLLPMAILESEEVEKIKPILEKHFLELGFAGRNLLQIVDCLISGIIQK